MLAAWDNYGLLTYSGLMEFKGTPLLKRKQASWPRRASPSV